MFIPKKISVYAEPDNLEDFEQTFGEDIVSDPCYTQQWYETHGYRSYICEKENVFNETMLYLGSNELFYSTEDCTPAKTVIESIRKYGTDGTANKSYHRNYNWNAAIKYGDDVILYKDGKDAAYIRVADEPFEFFEDTLKTARVSFNKAVCTQADMFIILTGVIEQYGCTALSPEQERLLVNNGYDIDKAVLDIGNGFTEKMTEDTHLEVLLNGGVISYNGHWHGKDEMNGDWQKYAGSIVNMTNAVFMRIDERNDDNERLVGFSLTEIYATKDKSRNYSVNLEEIKSNIISAIPYVFKAYEQYENEQGEYLDPQVKDITDTLTADFPESEYFRKFHISYELPDGRTFKGFINTSAENKEELPSQSDIKGTFTAERLSSGWIDRVQYEERTYKASDKIVVNGLFMPVTEHKGDITSTEQAEKILESASPVKLAVGETVPRFSGRLEEHIYSVETDVFEKIWNIKKNERKRQVQESLKKEGKVVRSYDR